MRYVCEFNTGVEVLLCFSFAKCQRLQRKRYAVFRTKSQKMLRLSIGVSSSQFISMPLLCSVSGQKIKSFVTAEMHFAQRVLSYSGTGGETKAERGEGGREKTWWEVGHRKNKHVLAGQKKHYSIPTYSITVRRNLYVSNTTMLCCITTKEVKYIVFFS